MNLHKSTSALFLVLLFSGCTHNFEKNCKTRIESRDFPSIFQAWYPVELNNSSSGKNLSHLEAVAKHDLVWEEPISQSLENYELPIGVEWDHQYPGLANGFTKKSIIKARSNHKLLKKLNPNLISLIEIRWRDAPQCFLPNDNEMWLRDSLGQKQLGWKGSKIPYYLLDYKSEAVQNNIAKQAKLATELDLYDGIILDWSGNLEIIKKVRNAIGPDKLIIVNIHDDIEYGQLYKDYINGSFMELNPIDYGPLKYNNHRDWDRIREALIWYEKNLRKPVINCLEVNGERDDLSRMRAATTLGLVYSNGYQLFGDYNPLPSPDHLHNWYPFWDVQLGKPLGNFVEKDDGSALREFNYGTVVYNHYKNNPIIIEFKEPKKRASTNEIGKIFSMKDRDGDIFMNVD